MLLFHKDSPEVPSTEALGVFEVGLKGDFVSLAIFCLPQDVKL